MERNGFILYHNLMLMVIEKIEKWLKEGRDDAEDLVDLPWNVRYENGILIAEHPKIPFTLYVKDDENYVRLRVYPGINTALLNQDERLEITRALMILNGNVDLLKFTLEGIDESVVLRIDLDKASFDKKVFEDSLTSLLAGLYLMVRALHLEEEFSKQLLDRVVGMVKERLNSGATRDSLIKFLVTKVGLKEDNAKEIIDEVIKNIKKEDLKDYA